MTATKVEYPPIVDLLPHRGPALLLDGVLSHDSAETVCCATVSVTMQYVENGKADAALSMELIAQAAAVRASLTRAESGATPRPGYVVSVPNMQFFGGDFSVGDVLEVAVRLERGQGSLGRFAGRVTSRGEPRAEGTLTVYETPLAHSKNGGDASGHEPGR